MDEDYGAFFPSRPTVGASRPETSGGAHEDDGVFIPPPPVQPRPDVEASAVAEAADMAEIEALAAIAAARRAHSIRGCGGDKGIGVEGDLDCTVPVAGPPRDAREGRDASALLSKCAGASADGSLGSLLRELGPEKHRASAALAKTAEASAVGSLGSLIQQASSDATVESLVQQAHADGSLKSVLKDGGDYVSAVGEPAGAALIRELKAMRSQMATLQLSQANLREELREEKAARCALEAKLPSSGMPSSQIRPASGHAGGSYLDAADFGPVPRSPIKSPLGRDSGAYPTEAAFGDALACSLRRELEHDDAGRPECAPFADLPPEPRVTLFRNPFDSNALAPIPRMLPLRRPTGDSMVEQEIAPARLAADGELGPAGAGDGAHTGVDVTLHSARSSPTSSGGNAAAPPPLVESPAARSPLAASADSSSHYLLPAASRGSLPAASPAVAFRNSGSLPVASPVLGSRASGSPPPLASPTLASRISGSHPLASPPFGSRNAASDGASLVVGWRSGSSPALGLRAAKSPLSGSFRSHSAKSEVVGSSAVLQRAGEHATQGVVAVEITDQLWAMEHRWRRIQSETIGLRKALEARRSFAERAHGAPKREAEQRSGAAAPRRSGVAA